VPASDQPWFINAVVEIGTEWPAPELLARLLSFEARFGRERGVRDAARTLDLDLLDYDGIQCSTPDLVLPHPRLQERRFVLMPLDEIAPQWRHPRLGMTAAELLARLPPGQAIRRLDDVNGDADERRADRNGSLWLTGVADINARASLPGIRLGDLMGVHDTARTNMIESQLRPNKVTDERIIDAFARVRRELFAPEHLRGVAYIDEDLPLGRGRYLMEPMVAARLLQAMMPGAKETALVVGAGVGYEAAILALLTRSVIALEDDEQLARLGRAALVDHRIGSVVYVDGPLKAGHRQRAPYDLILFAGAVAEIPSEIAAQLAEAGRMAAVLRAAQGLGRATLTTRTGGVLAHRVIFDAATRLLPGFVPKPAFVF
jgi:protein-L-isoaspartate(D-aspartate) O-methyltransferase